MDNLKNVNLYIKLLLCSFLSALVFFSFRIDLIYNSSLNTFLSFLSILFIVWSIFIFSKKSLTRVIFYNLLTIIILNLILTPLFYRITFDIPSRQANYKIVKEYKSKFFEGIFSGKHIISSDKKGYRVSSYLDNNIINEKTNYELKDNNTLRIFTIGASTTEGGSIDDRKTWSSLMGARLSKITNKKVEVINTGMAGLRSKHHYFTFQRIKKYKPDLVIFLTGINDWNHHVVNSDKRYLIPWFEIRYSFNKSIIYKTFNNINKQIRKKLFSKKNLENENATYVSAELDTEAYLAPQINSLNIRKISKKFYKKTVSEDYSYWMNSIFQDCESRDPICVFMDQPTAYQKEITNDLKKRLWMTPPNQEYTLSFKNLIYLSSMYNNWLRNEVKDRKLNFCLLSDKIEANTSNFTDDCHFSEKGSIKVSEILANYINLSLNLILK
jgi:lysophospholipase L1-like esterase